MLIKIIEIIGIQESIHVDQREQYKKPSSDPRNQVQPIESVSPAMTYEVQPESRRKS